MRQLKAHRRDYKAFLNHMCDRLVDSEEEYSICKDLVSRSRGSGFGRLFDVVRFKPAVVGTCQRA